MKDRHINLSGRHADNPGIAFQAGPVNQLDHISGFQPENIPDMDWRHHR